MKVAICDDNINYISIIENYINKFKKDAVECDAYTSGEDLVYSYRDKKERYDVIFLDMEMGQLNGIETANIIREIDEHVIIVFVTSHTEYMRESFKCSPFRFLVKPVDDEEFETVFYDICKKLSKIKMVFAFSENKTKVRLFCDDIICCESQGHWIWIYTKEQTYKLRKSMNELYEKLDKNMLYRVHKSFIVNFHYIKLIKENDIELYHFNKTVPISRSYRKMTLEDYTNFVERNLFV